MKKLKIIFAIILFVVLFACSKDDNSPPTLTPTPPVAENPIAISSFNPITGVKNTTVVLTGRGFSDNAVSNLVTLNGKLCPVLQASSTQLIITIPSNSATGNIKVTVGGFSQESAPFTYIDTIEVSTIAGSVFGFANGQGTVAKFDTPTDVAVDAAGNLYIADSVNNKIRKITPSGVVSTFAGSTVGFTEGQGVNAKFSNPCGITIDAAGNLYVADTDNNRIRQITPTGFVSTLAGSTSGFDEGQGAAAKFKNPQGICIDVSGNLYVADSGNHKIRKISPTGLVSTIAGSAEGFANDQGTAAQFKKPYKITIDIAGNLYVADTFNHKIRKISTTGLVNTSAGSTKGFADGQGGIEQFNVPIGIAIDVKGNLYVADSQNHKIRKINPTGLVTTIAGSTNSFANGQGIDAKFGIPTGICIDTNGTLYVTDGINEKIRKIVIN